jgi:hypothetical protein
MGIYVTYRHDQAQQVITLHHLSLRISNSIRVLLLLLLRFLGRWFVISALVDRITTTIIINIINIWLGSFHFRRKDFALNKGE